MDVDTGEVYEFKQGDFYAILPGTAYAQRVKAGTKILFIKTPSINDKELVEIDEEKQQWLEQKMKTVRKDYYHQPDAPAVNSIRPAAAVAIQNDKDELLMLHRKDNGKWTIPGRTMEFGESITECALREVKEECGLDVKIKGVIDTYTDPQVRIAYSDGEVRQEFTILYYGETEGYAVTLDDESSNYQWVALDRILDLPMADSQKRRVEDAIRYIQSKK